MLGTCLDISRTVYIAIADSGPREPQYIGALLYSSYRPETKILSCFGQITPVKIWWNLPISNPKPDSLMSMHIASLDKIPCYILKLSSRNKNMGLSRTDNAVKIWWNLPISHPKPDIQNINAHTKFGENRLMFTQVIIRKRKTSRPTDVQWTDGQTYRRPTWNHNTPPLLCGGV